MTLRPAALIPWPALTAAVLFVATGCAPSKFAVERSPDLDKYQIKTIAVVPFDAIETPQVTEQRSPEFFVPGGAKRSDISLGKPDVTPKLEYPTMGIPPYAPEKVTRMVYGRLQNWKGITVLTLEESGNALKALGTGKDLPVGPLTQKLASILKVDAVLYGRVLVYQERKGNKFGGESATVGFELKLIAADGRTLWAGNYYEQQRPMNEDLMGFMQRGGVFVTAEELAEYGVEHLLREFPYGEPVSRAG